MSGAGSGIFGTVEGSLFRTPAWVDLSRAPGFTPQPVSPWAKWFQSVYTLKYFFLSPNLIWFAFAVLDYTIFPYDLRLAKKWSVIWVLHRASVNFLLMFAYYSFWFCTLYLFNYGTRKFKAEHSIPSVMNLCHNIWFTCLGCLQLTAWEVLILHCYATGKLKFISDEEALSSPAKIFETMAWILAVPLWRGVHFYFSHRFIHIRALYKYVHSLHHRNTDIEPFAGLSMHPVEHLYYFSCLAPSIYFRVSPFVLVWNAMHLLLSPAASHSGFEDHTQSDQFHYVHHQKFECNYGSASFPLDKLFGTFRETLGSSKLYKGGDTENLKKNKIRAGNIKQSSLNSKATLFGLPDVYFGALYLFTACIFFVFYLAILGQFEPQLAPYIAAAIAFGPVCFAIFLYSYSGDRQPMWWPFHKEQLFPNFSLHLCWLHHQCTTSISSHTFGSIMNTFSLVLQHYVK